MVMVSDSGGVGDDAKQRFAVDTPSIPSILLNLTNTKTFHRNGVVKGYGKKTETETYSSSTSRKVPKL